MFESFIYQYGQDLFRPDGYVTRENLMLVLKEYHILTKRLLSQNRQILSNVNKLKTQKLSAENMELILQEFQNVLEPMLRNSETILALKQQKGESSMGAGISGSGYSHAQGGLESGSKKDVTALKSDLEKVKNEIKNLNKSVYAQKKYINKMSKGKDISGPEVDYLQDEVESLNKKIENFIKSYAHEDRLNAQYKEKNVFRADALKGELVKIKKEIKDLKKNIGEQKKYIDDISRKENAFKSAGGDIIPFWVKMSIGFSTIALFFMAR